MAAVEAAPTVIDAHVEGTAGLSKLLLPSPRINSSASSITRVRFFRAVFLPKTPRGRKAVGVESAAISSAHLNTMGNRAKGPQNERTNT